MEKIFLNSLRLCHRIIFVVQSHIHLLLRFYNIPSIRGTKGVITRDYMKKKKKKSREIGRGTCHHILKRRDFSPRSWSPFHGTSLLYQVEMFWRLSWTHVAREKAIYITHPDATLYIHFYYTCVHFYIICFHYFSRIILYYRVGFVCKTLQTCIRIKCIVYKREFFFKSKTIY